MSTAATTRRRLLRMTATVAALASLPALGAEGSAPVSAASRVSSPGHIRRAILVPRFGGNAGTDWYPTAVSQLADLGIRTEVVSLLPEPTAPGIEETVAAIDKVVGDDTRDAQTLLLGHSVGSRALLAYLNQHGAHRYFAGLVSVAGWFAVDDLKSYPVLAPWVNLDLDFASITAAAGPITVHLSDNDPFTADWRSTAADWLGKLGATVHITHGAGHYMATSPGPVLDTVRIAAFDASKNANARRDT